LRLGLVIAKNLAIDETRRRREDALPVGHDASFEPAAPDPLLRRRIAECFEKLPPQPALAMQARIEAGGLDADVVVAERIGMRTNTFFQNVARARKLLVTCLERHGVTFSQLLEAGVEVVR
jgi:RNA polymerase sigma-70 factor (ECF subfamily)